jgi:hypothetical protein
METERLLKITVWIYVAALLALTIAHIHWQNVGGDPFNIYRAIALCLAGFLARRAYPAAPSFALLLIIGTVCALGFIHMLTVGNGGRPLDIIVDMASGMWGVALGVAADKLRMRPGLRRRTAD